MKRRETPKQGVGGSQVIKASYQTRGGKLRGLSSSIDQQITWYEQPAERIWEYLRARVRTVKQKQIRRRYELSVYQNFYCDFDSYFAGNLYTGSNGGQWNGAGYRLSTNVIQTCIDAATARIAKDKPRVFCMPNTSDTRIIKKAENQTKFLDGAFMAGGHYEVSEDTFRDGGIYGDGALWLRDITNQVTAHALKQDEIFIDPIDGMHNDPQEIFVEIPESRRALLQRYKRVPGAAEAIERAKSSWRGDMSFMGLADQVHVTYAWRKKSHEDSDDGKYAVCIDQFTLEFGDWDEDFFPVLRWQWTPPTYGPFGIGIAHRLEGRQMAISSIMRAVMTSVNLFAVPRVWLEKMSNVSQHSLTNEDGTVNYYSGQPPVFSTPSAAAPDIYQFLQWLISEAPKEVGLSDMSVTSEKPAGLNAAVAIRTYQDVETQRFAIVGQRWERFYVKMAEVTLALAAKIYGRTKKYSVKVPGRRFLKTIDWSDIGLKSDQYNLAAYPTSLLPKTPEGQLQTVQELINSGFMPKDVALQQLRVPNLNPWIDSETASRDNIMAAILSIRDKKKYKPPNGIAEIDLCVTEAMNAWLQSDADPNAPPEVTDMLLRFLTEAQSKQAAVKAAAAPPPAPPGAPGGGPVVGQAPAPPPAPMAAAGAGPVQAAAA